MSITLTSPSFENGAAIPRRHTCDGDNQSPALAWSGIPGGARSLALICSDPDAPGRTWIHWLAWNLPPGLPGLPAQVPQGDPLEQGGRQGRNDSNHQGYDGACPPPGKPHRYYFTLYALDRLLELEPGAGKAALDAALGDHVLATGQLMGTYQRPR